MSKSTIQELADYGQSAWLDYISRPLLDTGKLKKLIKQGLRGMTSNPSIFNQAIGSSNDYDEKIGQLKHQGKNAFEIYDELSVRDIQDAADQFADVFQQTEGLDGYVSLEINPLLANKVDEQVKEGKRLYKKVNRPNLMIKVPSTNEGFKVFEELIADGINVNVTLIFSLEQYVETVKAYFRGLKRLHDKKGILSKVRSVASVFVSRIDTSVDKMLDLKLSKETDPAVRKKLESLKGRAAVANCHIIYEKYREMFMGRDFRKLFDQGANNQRVLWGSTSTKNPEYSDIKYVTELIVKPTVNTIPSNTLEAFLDHGVVKPGFHYDAEVSEKVITELSEFGIDINQVCDQLLDEGCAAFNKAFETLLATIEKKAGQLAVK